MQLRVVLLGGGGVSVCAIYMGESPLEDVSDLVFVLDESFTYGLECCRNVGDGRKVVSSVKSFVNAKALQNEFGRVLLEGLVVSVLMYGREAIVWK